MNQVREACAAAVHSNTIYVFDGRDENDNIVKTAETLDTANSEGGWNLISDQMVTMRWSHCVASVGDIIYIIGGRGNNNVQLNSVELFDTSTWTFRRGPSLPMPIYDVSAVSVGKLIIVVRGYNLSCHLIGESYVLDTAAPDSQWKRIDVSLQTPRCVHATILINSNLYVCGGYSYGCLDTIELISIVDLLPHDVLDMTPLHILCCNPKVAFGMVQSLAEGNPSALSHRDVTGKTPLQQFLLCRGLFGAGVEKNNSINNGTVQEGPLPSLFDLLGNGIKSKDLDSLFVLKNDFRDDLLVCDESTNLIPFMSAATMSECGLDVVYSLAMGKPDIILKMFSGS